MKKAIKYSEANFLFYIGSVPYKVNWEGEKSPYMVNIFKDGNYLLSISCNHNPNKSNSKDILKSLIEKATE